MIALYIIFAVLAVFLILLFSRAGITVSYNTKKAPDSVKLYVSYIFFKIAIFPKNEKIRLSDYTYKKSEKRKNKAEKKEKKKKDTSNTASHTSPNSAKKAKQKKKTDTVRILIDIRELIFDTLKAFPGKLRLDISRLHLNVGCENAASTAITYGAVTQAVGTVLTLLEESPVKIKRGHKYDVMITPDFVSGKTDANIKIKFSIRPASVISIGLKFIVGFFKYKLSKTETKQTKNYK